MIDRLLENVAPHHCYNCGKVGTLLCDNCKYDISFDVFANCFLCGRPTSTNGSCPHCALPYERLWCAGERTGVLRRLIDGYKFENARAAHGVLADVLLAVLPVLPENTIVVPIPTLASHIRERGYDHAVLLARAVANKRGLRCKRMLHRVDHTKQRGADKPTRWLQAEKAFGVSRRVDEARCLIIDDVVTTGATLYHAAKVLKDAGAKEVWVAAAARQPLD
jgi:competence protein ComFC